MLDSSVSGISLWPTGDTGDTRAAGVPWSHMVEPSRNCCGGSQQVCKSMGCILYGTASITVCAFMFTKDDVDMYKYLMMHICSLSLSLSLSLFLSPAEQNILNSTKHSGHNIKCV